MIAAALVQLALPTLALHAQDSGKKQTATEKSAVDYNKLYAAALADFNANRNLQATQKFRQVLKRYPEHIQSKRHLAILRNRIREDAAVPMMKKNLAKLNVTEIDFEDATLAEVMEYVTAEAKKLSGGKLTPGLVIHGGEAVRERKLTFKTGKAPLSSLIDTAADLTDTTVHYSQHALTFRPKPTAAELQAAAAKKLEAEEAKRRAKEAEEAAANDPFLRRKR